MTEIVQDWTGAQWLAAVVFFVGAVFSTVATPFVQKSLGTYKGLPEFLGWWLAQMLARAFWIAVLAWGGFW